MAGTFRSPLATKADGSRTCQVQLSATSKRKASFWLVSASTAAASWRPMSTSYTLVQRLVASSVRLGRRGGR